MIIYPMDSTYRFMTLLKITLPTPKQNGLNNFLRPVDALLCIGKDILLFSEREENNLLPLFWKESRGLSGDHQIFFLNLAFLEARRLKELLSANSSFTSNWTSGPSIMIDDISILALQVFTMGNPCITTELFFC